MNRWWLYNISTWLCNFLFRFWASSLWLCCFFYHFFLFIPFFIFSQTSWFILKRIKSESSAKMIKSLHLLIFLCISRVLIFENFCVHQKGKRCILQSSNVTSKTKTIPTNNYASSVAFMFIPRRNTCQRTHETYYLHVVFTTLLKIYDLLANIYTNLHNNSLQQETT